MPRTCNVGAHEIGPQRPLAVIAGPCVLESLELGRAIAGAIGETCTGLGLPFVFKASFDKANRSSMSSYRGPGIDQGLEWMASIGEEFGCPTTTDVHEPAQAERVAGVVDLLQVPAFLARQTDLVVECARAAAANGRAVNIKKGQFMAPAEMKGPAQKAAEGGCDNLMFTERGTFFGYHRLVNDFTGLGDLMELDTPGGVPPLCFDVTHSTQLPGSGSQTGGKPERAPLLARAATAAGVHALFIEAHADPANAKSDGATVLDLETATSVLTQAARIREALNA